MVYIVLGIVLSLVLIVVAFFTGLYIQSLKDKNTNLKEHVDELELEASSEAEEESAIVDITPKAISRREHDSNYPKNEDSAVIRIKTRGELAKEKERELDKLVGQYK